MIHNITPQQTTAGYAEMASMYLGEGWTPYFMTFMFQQLPGGPQAVARQMERAVERVYSRFVTRTFRYPNSVHAVGKLPIWIGGPDYPVFKYAKQSLPDVTINDGRHLHIVDLQPPHSRLPDDVPTHFEGNESFYVRPELGLARIHVVLVTHDLEKVVAYALKALTSGRVEGDTTVILPRSRTEMPSRSGKSPGMRFGEGRPTP